MKCRLGVYPVTLDFTGEYRSQQLIQGGNEDKKSLSVFRGWDSDSSWFVYYKLCY